VGHIALQTLPALGSEGARAQVVNALRLRANNASATLLGRSEGPLLSLCKDPEDAALARGP
jgi:hypothetical protein